MSRGVGVIVLLGILTIVDSETEIAPVSSGVIITADSKVFNDALLVCCGNGFLTVTVKDDDFTSGLDRTIDRFLPQYGIDDAIIAVLLTGVTGETNIGKENEDNPSNVKPGRGGRSDICKIRPGTIDVDWAGIVVMEEENKPCSIDGGTTDTSGGSRIPGNTGPDNAGIDENK